MSDKPADGRPPHYGSDESLRECRKCHSPFLPTPRQRRRWDWECPACDLATPRFDVRVHRSHVATLRAVSEQLGKKPASLLRESALMRATAERTGSDPSTTITVALKPDERELIQRAARAVGVPPSTYIRDSALSFMAGLLSQQRPGGMSGGGSIGSWK